MDIREIDVPEAKGKLFIGRFPISGEGDFSTLLERESYGVAVMLATKDELESVPALHALWQEGTVAAKQYWLNTPNLSIPDDERGLGEALSGAVEALKKGDQVLVLCPTGIGRSGTFGVCLLVMLGVDQLEAAIRLADAAAGPESGIQESLVEAVVRYAATRI
ncbi:MAG TPA: hypothetical protein P5568_13125 [Acidobacteriota bacterium]|jgi:hypothetical protein|nr:hypothetical protein [Acidobacteriota bacterium]HRV09402.1 hypothetical protein [Acidobacteriota bacterium]